MNFAVIGNCKSAALIDQQGTMNWLCLPDFDSASVFGSMLDERRGGFFAIEAEFGCRIKQNYIRNTNIVETVFEGESGSFAIIDFMPRYKESDTLYNCPPEVIRYIRPLCGKPRFRVRYNPRLGYGEHETHSFKERNFIKSTVSNGSYESIYLYTNMAFDDVLASRDVSLGDEIYFVVSYHQKILPPNIERIQLNFERTKVYWLDWIQRTFEFRHFVDAVRRSALVLKMLAFQESGAILAAVTTSLPETIGEERNWDYRFCWIRDASMILRVLTKIGHFNVARNFFDYLMRVVPYKDDKVRIMYGIRGRKELPEQTLDWLDGYKGSKPVRIGNAASIQQQNDIYGVLLDAIHRFIETFRSDVSTIERLWTITRSLLRTVESNWNKPDMGIWEFRGGTAHFVFSKVMCWVAMDRGIKIAEQLQRADYYHHWEEIRAEIKADVMANGWNAEMGAFTQSYGSCCLDAANLLMAEYGFIDPMDPKYVATVELTSRELCRDGLMYRYRNQDDFGLPKSSFTVCSFWMVKALWSIGCHREAHRMFKRLLTYCNHVGLLSEDLDFETKELLGNFPQGYSHLALIDCALALCEGNFQDESKLVDFIRNIERVEV